MGVRPDVADRALRLVAAFEGHGGGVAAGNFDGQTLTWGDLGYNIGQGTLVPVLRRIRDLDQTGFTSIMGPDFAQLAVTGGLLFTDYVRRIVLDERGRVRRDWQERFMALYRTDAARQALREAAQRYLGKAEAIATTYAFHTERGYCLALDIAVQNGSVLPTAQRRFEDNVESHSGEEWRRLRAMAYAVADAANPRWRQDVLSRKLCVAVGRGRVHGRDYDLERDFGIRYAETWEQEGDET
ncbi:MAG: hypothetical protein QN174_13335 [Armatimonadota bacterium]|nr:hypothetical protein [Armatimonadota bacterium]